MKPWHYYLLGAGGLAALAYWWTTMDDKPTIQNQSDKAPPVAGYNYGLSMPSSGGAKYQAPSGDSGGIDLSTLGTATDVAKGGAEAASALHNECLKRDPTKGALYWMCMSDKGGLTGKDSLTDKLLTGRSL